MTKDTFGPDMNGRVQAVPERFSTEPLQLDVAGLEAAKNVYSKEGVNYHGPRLSAAIRAYLAATQAAPVAVMGLEPTVEMSAAGMRVIKNIQADHFHKYAGGIANSIFEAMMLAAPATLAVPGDVVAYIDINGQVSIPEGSKLGDVLRAMPKPPVGKACLPLYAAPLPTGLGGAVAWRWRIKGAETWVYDPTPDWIAAQRIRDDIDVEPLFAAPPKPVADTGVPDGYVLVPSEPSDAETNAALKAYWSSVERGYGTMSASFTTNHSMKAALRGSREFLALAAASQRSER